MALLTIVDHVERAACSLGTYSRLFSCKVPLWVKSKWRLVIVTATSAEHTTGLISFFTLWCETDFLSSRTYALCGFAGLSFYGKAMTLKLSLSRSLRGVLPTRSLKCQCSRQFAGVRLRSWVIGWYSSLRSEWLLSYLEPYYCLAWVRYLPMTSKRFAAQTLWQCQSLLSMLFLYYAIASEESENRQIACHPEPVSGSISTVLGSCFPHPRLHSSFGAQANSSPRGEGLKPRSWQEIVLLLAKSKAGWEIWTEGGAGGWLLNFFFYLVAMLCVETLLPVFVHLWWLKGFLFHI